MARKGTYTGRKITPPDFRKPVTIGKISGYTGAGKPVYDLERNGEKVGELNVTFIKKYLKMR